MRRMIVLLGVLAGCAAPDAATTAHPFDGGWAVTLTCAAAPDGALGYVYRFPAEVRESTLRGENGREGSAEWLLLRGPIRADGQASLAAQGLTGAVANNAGRVPTMTPYRYTVQARFEGRSGQGRRVETRACAFDFVKR